MHFGSRSSLSLWRQKTLYLSALLFLCLYYILIFTGPLNSVSMDVMVSAEKAGQMTFFLPTSGNRYSQSRSRQVGYPSGSSSHHMQISHMSSLLNLRFDPDSKANTFQLRTLSFSRNGKTISLTGRQLDSYVTEANGLSRYLSADSMVMNLMTEDPQLILAGLPIPPVTLLLWFGPIPVLFLLLAAVRMAARFDGQWTGRFTALALIGLAVMYWHGPSPGESLFTAQLTAAMASLALVFSLLVLADNWQQGRRFGFIGSVLIIAVLITLLLGQMVLTLNPGNVTGIKKNVMTAFADNRSAGINSALMHARDALEKTFVRSFHFRRQLLTLNAESKIFGLGFSPTTRVIIGRDDWFFEGYGRRRVEGNLVRPFDNITDYMGQNPFTEADLEAWRITLEERYYWLRERGTDYVFALAPTKALVYPEKLPAKILKMKQRLKRPTRYDQLINYLQEHSVVPVVDLRRALLEAKEDNPEIPLFYRTDFHWNYYGALRAYQAIIAAINGAYPHYGLQPGRVDEFVISKKTNWVHARFMNMVGLDPSRHQNETYYTLYPKPGSRFAQIADFAKQGISDRAIPKAAVKRMGKAKFSMRELDNPNGRMGLLFVIGDSFIEKTLGYFSLHARKTMNFRVVTNFPTIPYTQMEMQPDIVVQEVLNMYLLQPPPANPPHLRQARVRALAGGK